MGCAMREAIGLFPAGRFEFECMNDGFDEPIRLQVAFERRGAIAALSLILGSTGGALPAVRLPTRIALFFLRRQMHRGAGRSEQ